MPENSFAKYTKCTTNLLNVTK